jgi:hemolysin III
MTLRTELRAYRLAEYAADRAIHVIGTSAGIVGSAALVAIAAAAANRSILIASLIYAVCLVTMLGCSAAYNLAGGSPRGQMLRRCDHAAIFLMIAGTYTPFTTCRLHGPWAVGMTAAVWTGALAGAAAKLMCPHRLERASTAAYLLLGWVIVIGIRPLLDSVDAETATLIGIGGTLYSIGAGIHLWRTLPFQAAIWHGLVLLAAGCHYIAILHGVVLAPA